ncbi:UDP-N-acetylglucosamine 2-epimerase (hydrolyzing) [Polynucleobacter paneuropaeus]|jgi:UDP-N-acetylglucosamine 2-epimerase (hydrolysing)|uniref:UDP-N-acetylglucosamine 2-epimerase n=1 Tax=Polynucleobacter paneuropaeus TaxID=2527775 RepID=UPI001BFDBBC4|nr:UDP-N-acetylglucosamine 2-epimerase [Polynucleobacter paneuropaeus]MBT8633206.1 UDP-N-acetylglucosamine 2-epimerase (hydrolyzing) [Polynucleobacter paneuropaeus]
MKSNNKLRKVVFLTGTRADFGKLKSLMQKLASDPMFEIHIFVTGMHMLSKYGFTAEEVKKSGFQNIYKYINQNVNDSMDQILAKTIAGFSDYVKETSPDLLIVHGDRVEALAGAIVGALNNILVAHIEGGEVSGTIDELIRHAVSKLSHLHFVSNVTAKNRLIQLGESKNNTYIIGSPDIDIMNSASLPALDVVKEYYNFEYSSYSILLFHPVTTDISNLRKDIRILVDQVLVSGLNYIVIYPNNDHGTEIILEEYQRFNDNSNIKIFPSMRFEYFITALKNANFIIGNSSAGIKEAPYFGVPAINIGTRQLGRIKCELVVDTINEASAIANAITLVKNLAKQPLSLFGDGNSADKFHETLKTESFWACTPQKYFIDQAINDL